VDDVRWLNQTDDGRKAYPVYVFLFDVCSWLVVPDDGRKAYPVYVFLFDVCSWLVVPDKCDIWLTWSEIEWNFVCLFILGYFVSFIGPTRRPVETQVN
jgi:hypothetical protein